MCQFDIERFSQRVQVVHLVVSCVHELIMLSLDACDSVSCNEMCYMNKTYRIYMHMYVYIVVICVMKD
jgi:hypothetical protein